MMQEELELEDKSLKLIKKTKKPMIIDFEGVFGEKIQKGVYLKGEKKEGVFFVHGLYGNCFDEKYRKLSNFLNKKGYSVFLFNRSRLDHEILINENRQNQFQGKSFNDEIEDVKIALKHFLRISRLRKVHYAGFSLGGTLSSFLVKNFNSYLKTIFLFGSGLSTKNKNRPIVNRFPEKSLILNNFSSYSGKIILVQGTYDDVVPIEEAREIITYHKNKAPLTKLILLRGVDHQFKRIKGRPSELKLTKLIYQIILGEISNFT
ncbi:MAG: alpha/beta hydrolase [Patescibacteria group bacterium]|nr:alpha/beta hydrolase [Patescibacteria group bacterium]